MLNYTVLPGFIVTIGAYRVHLKKSSLPERIATRLNNLQVQQLQVQDNTAQETQVEIRRID